MIDEQTAILARWDSLNTKRKIVGFSVVDTHENQNIHARYIKNGRIEWVGPDANIIDTTEIHSEINGSFIRRIKAAGFSE